MHIRPEPQTPRRASLSLAGARDAVLNGTGLWLCVLVFLWFVRPHELCAQDALAAPVITAQPAELPQRAGEGIVRVTATGEGLGYQWYRGEPGDTSAPVTGGTGALLILPPMDAGGRLWVRVTNAAGAVDSVGLDVSIPAPRPLALWGMGSNANGQLGGSFPASAATPQMIRKDVVKIAAGEFTTAYVRMDGSLWGYAGFGFSGWRSDTQLASDVVDVACGDRHMLFLKRDGTLWTLGKNEAGQRGATGLLDYRPSLLTSGIARIAAAGNYSLFLRCDGSLWGTGENVWGQLGVGDTTGRMTPVMIASGVVEIAAGAMHGGFVDASGRAWTMGGNAEAQLGDGTTSQRSLPVAVLDDVRRLSAGRAHTLWVKTNGSLWAAGENGSGELGIGDTVRRLTPTQVASGVRLIQAAYQNSFFIGADGALWGAGGNYEGELGIGSSANRVVFTRITEGVQTVVAGALHTVFLRLPPPRFVSQPDEVGVPAGQSATLRVVTSSDGPVSHQWYVGASGDLSRPIASAQAAVYTTPFRTVDARYWVRATNAYGSSDSATITVIACSSPGIDFMPTEAAAVAGQEFRVAVRASGGALAYQWYRGRPGDVSLPVEGATDRILRVGALAEDMLYWVRITNAAGSVDSSAVQARRLSHGSLLTAGSDARGQLGLARSLAPERIAEGVSKIAAGGAVSLWLDASGTLWGAGYGQALGLAVSVADAVRIADNVSEFSTGGRHTLFVKKDGTLWGVGGNERGQLGGGGDVAHTAPKWIASDVKAVACGLEHSIFLKADGSVWGMGGNSFSQISQSSAYTFTIPVRIAESAGGVAAGPYRTFIIKNDGTLWGAGANFYGELGLSVVAGSHLALRQIATDVTAAAAGGFHSWIMKSDGSLWTAGGNASGQLAIGSYTRRVGFVKAAEAVSAIAAGGANGFLLKGGTLYAAGENSSGEFGLGETAGSPAPIVVATGIRQAALGDGHALFLREDGTLWTSGSNVEGQLSNGRRDLRTMPTFAADGVASASAGPSHTLWVRADGTLWGVGDNDYGQLGSTGRQSRRQPVLIAEDVSRAVAVDAATFFIKRDGGLWALGCNSGGLLGTGGTSQAMVPALVATEVREVCASGSDTVFVKNDNSAWGMGSVLTGSTVPVRLEESVRSVAITRYSLSVLKTDDSLWSFGYVASSTPRTKLADGVVEVQAGFDAIVYLRHDGSLWAAGVIPVDWGGEGNGVSVPAPVRVAEDVVRFRFAASPGSYQLHAVKTDGRVWASGNNSHGQLGLGDTVPRSVLTLTPLHGVLDIGGGASHAVFLVVSPPSVTQAPLSQVVRTGERVELSAAATGVGTLSYQWRRDGVPLSGASSRTSRLVIEPAQGSDSGVYDVVVSLVGQETIAGPARVTVHAEPQTSFAAWAAAHGVAGGPTADPDGGAGMPALLRYAFKLPATGPAAAPLEVGAAENAGGRRLAITFTRKGHAPDLSYVVEGSSDLVTWTPVEVVSPGVPERVTVEDDVAVGGGATARFLRVRVELAE